MLEICLARRREVGCMMKLLDGACRRKMN
jgi:hypothetical protein